MAAKTKDELFEELIGTRGWWRNLGLTEDQGNNYRTRFKAGKLSEDKVREILTLAGAKKKQEELWEI